MTTIGFIGLGIMGGPMAANLVAAGHDVIGYNRSRPAVERLVEAGGQAAAEVAGTVAKADMVFTMLPDSPEVEEVVAGPGGVLANAAPGLLVIDTSTIRPAVARRLAAEAGQRGIGMLDAPVSGGEQGAVDGTLAVMVGGSDADFATAKPVLNSVAQTVRHVGPSGSGQIVKAANQLVVAGIIELVAEAIGLLEASGVATGPALEVIGSGLAGNTILQRKGPAMVARDFTPGFRAELHHKDLGILMDSAREVGAATPVGSILSQLMAALPAQGAGQLDHTALLRIVDQLSGRNPEPAPDAGDNHG